jgi:signal transduction histidine kinase
VRNPRPLDRLPSIRAKLGSVIVFAVGMTVVFLYAVLWAVRGFHFLLETWWELLLGGAIASAGALFLARLLAIGMTRPLRDMAHAAGKMAQGDYGQRVHASSRDEVGQLAEAFNRMSTEFANVERLRRDLVANVSHELKTPISALRARLENILDGVEAPDPRVLQVMLQQTERLSRLVDQLLDLSRLDTGDVPLDREALDLDSVAHAVASEVEVARADHLVHVRVDVPADLPPLWADRERIHQVLFNLIDNAARFTPPGGEVAVSAVRSGQRCEVKVTDTGPGISPEHLPFLFDRFYRVDQARSRGDGGTGIGLAIAKSVVEAHGGGIRAESEVGRGSVFAFDVPLAQAHQRPTVRTGGNR